MTGGSRERRRILHAADLHLVSLSDTARHRLEALVKLVAESGAELLIIAGDLFDNNRVSDELVGFVVENLRSLPVETVILPGNHDCLAPDSAYRREDLWGGTLNVRIFKAPQGELFTFPALGISVWGKPIMSYSSDVQPLAGIPRYRVDGHWHIAVAHGNYVDTEFPHPPSFYIGQDEVAASGQDYIALGHVPSFRCVSTEPVKACYSGLAAIVDFENGVGVQVNPCIL